ncbi:alkaline phosphatase family protein [Lysinibacillus sp. FSL P4-0201]|uniref:alkaline phosphatase family protein n=1 Tax=Lysinibacillus sp. FSL P4-0201 TaxID=2921721 RepID=UPI003159B3FF
MELLVIGIDGVSPNLLFDYIEDYPNLKKLYEDGSGGSYNGYVYGYGSHDNWISMYTGVSPKVHGTIKGLYNGKKYPKPEYYCNKKPLWEILNYNGYSVGFWKGLATTPPVKIDGFMVSGEAVSEHKEVKEDYMSFNPIVCEKDLNIISNYYGDISNIPYPKTPEQLGTSWEELFENPNIIENYLTPDYFKEGLEYFKEVLHNSYINIENAFQKKPTDVFWFYDLTFDYIGHFQMHDENHEIMRKALIYVDEFVGKLVKLMSPKNILFLSDHGQRAIVDFFPNCSKEVRKNAFGLSDNCVITENHIIMKGRNPGFLSALHDLKGVMIWSGEKILKGIETDEMRTLDVYPTILELLNITIPKDREGYIIPLVNKDIVNKNYEYPKKPNVKKVLFIQTIPVNEFNGFLNEYYYENRFTQIDVAIDIRYEQVFKVNYQVNEIINVDNLMSVDYSKYDKVFAILSDKSQKYQIIIHENASYGL